MGSRGPVPSPTAARRSRGPRRNRRKRVEPRPTSFEEIPSPPEHLDEIGQEVWRRLVPDLIAKGVFTPWDVDQFATYCELESKKRAAAKLMDVGLLVRGRRDPVVTNPGWRVYRDLVKLQLQLAREFGLTPSARAMLPMDDDLSG